VSSQSAEGGCLQISSPQPKQPYSPVARWRRTWHARSGWSAAEGAGRGSRSDVVAGTAAGDGECGSGRGLAVEQAQSSPPTSRWRAQLGKDGRFISHRKLRREAAEVNRSPLDRAPPRASVSENCDGSAANLPFCHV